METFVQEVRGGKSKSFVLIGGFWRQNCVHGNVLVGRLSTGVTEKNNSEFPLYYAQTTPKQNK